MTGNIRIVVVTDDAKMNRAIEETVFQLFPEAEISLEFCPEHRLTAEELAQKACNPAPQIVVIGSRAHQVWCLNVGTQVRELCPNVQIAINIPSLNVQQDVALIEIQRRCGEVGKFASNLGDLRLLLMEFAREL